MQLGDLRVKTGPALRVVAELPALISRTIFPEDHLSTILFRARWAPADLGTNRWALKPAVGMIVPLHPTWLFEIEVGAWLFGDNDDFLGETRE